MGLNIVSFIFYYFDMHQGEELKHPVNLDLLQNLGMQSIFSSEADYILFSSVNSMNAVHSRTMKVYYINTVKHYLVRVL